MTVTGRSPRRRGRCCSPMAIRGGNMMRRAGCITTARGIMIRRLGCLCRVIRLGLRGGPFNTYGYVVGNPYFWNDPKGLEIMSFLSNTNISAAGAASTGFGIGASVILLSGQIGNAIRDLSKIHIAPGSALNNPPEDGTTGPPPPPPPGDCSRKQLKRMERAKDRADARARSCHEKDSLGTLSWNLARLEELKFRRAIIMSTCFRGGDAGHRTALQQVQNRINNCVSIIASRAGRHGG